PSAAAAGTAADFPLSFRALTRGQTDHGLPDDDNLDDGLDDPASIRSRCPFARDPQSHKAADFWEHALEDGMISLGRPDVGSSKARDVYDALDTFGTILTCCPGLLVPGATAAATTATAVVGGTP
ncbi:unnamed protein product, partial [Laminaria digitata]